MSQIVTVQVGGCGTKVGLSFWEEFYGNMQLNSNKDQEHTCHYQRFLSQQKEGKKQPRTVFIDTDFRSQNMLVTNKLNFDPNSIVVDKNLNFSNIYDRHTVRNDFQERLTQSLRKQQQKCDCISGCLIIRSPTGGTGSRIGDLVIQDIASNNVLIQQIKVLPGLSSKKLNSTSYMNTIQIYNTALSNNSSVINSDLVYFFENSAAQGLLQKRKDKNINFDAINKFYGVCLNEHINPYLQSGQLNTSQRKRATNLAPYPRIKHLCGSFSDLIQKDHLRSALDVQNRVMIYADKIEKMLYSVSIHTRDNCTSQNLVNKTVKTWANHTTNTFMEWISHNISLSIGRPHVKNGPSSWAIFNGANNIAWKRQLSQQFTSAFRRKGFIHHYINRGMDQMQLTESESNLNDIISEYNVYDYAIPEDDEEIHQ